MPYRDVFGKDLGKVLYHSAGKFGKPCSHVLYCADITFFQNHCGENTLGTYEEVQVPGCQCLDISELPVVRISGLIKEHQCSPPGGSQLQSL